MTLHRALAALIAILALCLGALWSADILLERRREETRAADSAFHRLGGSEGPAPASVFRIDLAIPGAPETWTYVKETDGWRMPQYRQGFAQGRALEGFLAALLEGRGTIVGRMPADAEHFGIVRGKALEADLRTAAGNLLLHGAAGRVAPGQRSGECFVTAEGRDAILHLDANPWAPVAWTPADRFPPLLDRHVIPEALGRGFPSRIELAGRSAPPVRALIRKDLPPDPRGMMADRGPRFEWYGVLDGPEQRVNDAAASGYAGSFGRLELEELLGPGAEGTGPFADPELTVTIDYDGKGRDTLILGGAGANGAHAILHATTKQAFLIPAPAARALAPDVKALLEPNPQRAPEPPGDPQRK
jgi:hypothetical protein